MPSLNKRRVTTSTPTLVLLVRQFGCFFVFFIVFCYFLCFGVVSLGWKRVSVGLGNFFWWELGFFCLFFGRCLLFWLVFLGLFGGVLAWCSMLVCVAFAYVEGLCGK